MAEQSKTAKAAAKAVATGESKKKEARTAEQAIRTLRELRAAHLHVSPNDVDLLLDEYDRVEKTLDSFVEGVARDQDQKKLTDARIAELEGQVADLTAQVEGYKAIARKELEVSTAKTETIASLATEGTFETVANDRQAEGEVDLDAAARQWDPLLFGDAAVKPVEGESGT